MNQNSYILTTAIPSPIALLGNINNTFLPSDLPFISARQ